MAKVGRTSCIVPHCRCTIATAKLEPDNQWVCRKHWRPIPKRMKWEYSFARRRAEKIMRRKPLYRKWWEYPPGSSDRLAAIRMWHKIDRLWEGLKAAAIEGAMGI